MSDLDELYQQVIIDHSRRPRNFRVLAGDNLRTSEGYNPLCGDRVTIYLTLDGDRVTDVSFQGSGCAISTASASMLTEQLKGKTTAEINTVFKNFHQLITGTSDETTASADLGKLEIFSGVCAFPTRVKCATLAWHTLIAALRNAVEPVSTE